MSKERVRRRQEARAGETDAIAVNIKKKKHAYSAVAVEQKAANTPAGVVDTKHGQQRKKENKKGRERWQGL